MQFLSFKGAKRIYDLFVIKREYKQNINKDFLNKYSFLILSNLFDRDFASGEYCVHETFFLFRKKSLSIIQKINFKYLFLMKFFF